MYWFQPRLGVHRFPSYRRAFEAGQKFGEPQIWFTVGNLNYRVEHIEGQEAFGIGGPAPTPMKHADYVREVEWFFECGVSPELTAAALRKSLSSLEALCRGAGRRDLSLAFRRIIDARRTCRTCGDSTKAQCSVCQIPFCGAHLWRYKDEANIAITRSAQPKCGACDPNLGRNYPRPPRPYTLARAIERGEWWLM